MQTWVYNIRYLIWRHVQEKNQWQDYLSGLVGESPEHVKEILEGRVLDLKSKVFERLADKWEIPLEDLFAAELWKASNVFMENLNTLMESTNMTNAEVCREKGIEAATFSKWRHGKHKPGREGAKKIKDFFGLPEGMDLRGHPLFLELEPLSVMERKHCLAKMIFEMDSKTTNLYFHAMKRLLEKS